jgi:hypothetical protein
MISDSDIIDTRLITAVKLIKKSSIAKPGDRYTR